MPQAATSPRPPTNSSSAGSTRATPAPSGTAAPSNPPSRPSSPMAGRRWTPTPPTPGPSGPGRPPQPPTRDRSDADATDGRRRSGAPPSKPAPFVTGLRTTDWAPAPVAQTSRRLGPARPGHLPAHRGHAARRHDQAGHGLRLRRPHLPPLRQRRRRRRLAQLLVPRRAVRPRRRPHPHASAPAPPTPSASCTAGTGRDRDAPPRRPASSSPSRSGTTTAATSSTAPTARGVSTPAEWLPSPQRNSDVGDFVEWIDGRAHPEGWSSPGYDDSGWSPVTVIGPAGTAPFTHTFAQRTDIEETTVLPVRLHTLPDGSVVADFGAVYAARPRVDFASGVPGQTVAMRVGYLLDPDGQVSTLHGTQGTNLSFTYIMREGAQVFEAFTYLGFRYLQIDNAGQRSTVGRWPPWPGTPPCRRCPWRPSRPGTARSMRCGASTPARASTAARNSSSTRRRVRRASSPGTPSNESEAIMRCYGDQNLSWQGLRDVQRGQARYWPDGRTNAMYPNGDGARSFATFVRALRRVAVALLHGHGRPGDHAGAVPLRVQGGRPGCCRPSRAAPARTDSSTGWATPATATPSTATTSPWRPTRPATCWR